MHNIGSYLFWALAACTLLCKSLAEDRSGSVQGNEETSLEGKLQTLQAKVEETQTKLEGKMMKLENQLQEVLNKIENQRNTIPPGFERIGTRYFRLGEEFVDWLTAQRWCRQMGGYLASFRSEEEFTTVTTTLSNKTFWLGINDQNREGYFVSTASHKPAQYLKWAKGNPNNDHLISENCVLLQDGKMLRMTYETRAFFLCQADNET